MKKKIFKNASFVLVGLFIFTAGRLSNDIRLSSQLPRVSKNLPENLEYSSVESTYDTLRENYDGELDAAKLIDGMKQGLAEAAGDQYTEYFSADENNAFNSDIKGSFTGIGAELGKENNAIIVVTPIKGYPAEQAGLKSKDVILKIDGEDALSLSITEAVKKIRGPKDTAVVLTVFRETEQLEISITRTEIKIPSVTHRMTEGGVGIIEISRFSDDTTQLVLEAAKDFKNDPSFKAVVLDMRNNPGGYLEQAVSVASQWLDVGQVVVIEKRGGAAIKTDKALKGQAFLGIPTVVLINGGSASASEIVAGALHDHEVAKIVGEKSYGKGSVQQVAPLDGGSALKVTIARWFTPLDKNIDKQGIEPDFKVEITKEQAAAKQDPQLEKAIDILK